MDGPSRYSGWIWVRFGSVRVFRVGSRVWDWRDLLPAGLLFGLGSSGLVFGFGVSWLIYTKGFWFVGVGHAWFQRGQAYVR